MGRGGEDGEVVENDGALAGGVGFGKLGVEPDKLIAPDAPIVVLGVFGTGGGEALQVVGGSFELGGGRGMGCEAELVSIEA